jgi:hypothetical protein
VKVSNRLLENADAYAEAIRSAGARAATRLKRAGIPVYYMDETVADGIIKEFPDGTRQRVEVGDGKDVVIETLPPVR